jgi:hypothetical protein
MSPLGELGQSFYHHLDKQLWGWLTVVFPLIAKVHGAQTQRTDAHGGSGRQEAVSRQLGYRGRMLGEYRRRHDGGWWRH